MRAVVLVGGEGTRLRPLTLATPKQMLWVAECRMIERVVAHLGAHGVREVVLSLGYRPDAFTSAFGDGTVAGVRARLVVENEPLDTGGAIGFAARQAGITDAFIAVNGDVLTDVDVTGLVDFHRSRGARATIHVTPVADPSAYGVVDVAGDGRVGGFVEKPEPAQVTTNLINAGTYVLEPEILDLIPDGSRTSIEREVFPALVGDGLFAQASDAYWLDTGTPAKYHQAHADLLSGRRTGPPAPHARAAAPGVWTLGEVDVDGDVGARSLIGPGCVVERGARVSGSVVGHSARVGTGAWVVDSVVLPAASIASGSLVERSIVGEGAVVGEEAAVTASLLGDGHRVEPGSRIHDSRLPDEEGRGSPGLVEP